MGTLCIHHWEKRLDALSHCYRDLILTFNQVWSLSLDSLLPNQCGIPRSHDLVCLNPSGAATPVQDNHSASLTKNSYFHYSSADVFIPEAVRVPEEEEGLPAGGALL